MNEREKKAVEYLRNECADLLTPKYNTNFNLLRWAIGYDFDLNESLFHLRRHLKLRLFHFLDDAPSNAGHSILDKYFPIGIIGETIKDNNTLLVAECAGRIDLKGILKSVQLSDFLFQRYCFQERVIERLNEMEKRTGKQASVVYILDLDGLKLDSWLLSVVTGPYRILWASVYTNYPEWISTMLVVNCPPFMGLVWKAIYPLLPERTRGKMRICSNTADAKAAARSLVSSSRLPLQWGGELSSPAADAVSAHHDSIPISLYWKPSHTAPAITDLISLVIPPGKNVYATYTVQYDKPFFFVINRFCDRTFGMSLFHHLDEDPSKDTDEMRDWAPFFEYPGMPTVDRLIEKAPGPGTFKVHFSNEQAWIRSLEIRYRVLFEDEGGNEIPFTTHKTVFV